MKYAQQFKISDEYSCTECYDRDDQEFSMASKNIAKKSYTKWNILVILGFKNGEKTNAFIDPKKKAQKKH